VPIARPWIGLVVRDKVLLRVDGSLCVQPFLFFVPR
jgi:hypothetical protein